MSFLEANGQFQEEPSYPVPTTLLQSHTRCLDTYNQQYGLPDTTTPLAPFPHNSTLECVRVHGSHSQGYRGPVSHKSAATPLRLQQQPQFHVPVTHSFASGNRAAPMTHTNGAAYTPIYGPLFSNPVHAPQTHAALALALPPTNSLSTSITTSSSLEVPLSVGTLISADGGGPPLEERETDEGPPPPPPAAPCSPRHKRRSKLRKTMDDAPPERDMQKLLKWLREQGGDEAAIARVPVVFENGVSKNALKLRRRKTGGGRSINFDQGYMNFVGRRQVKKENEMGEYYEDEWWCRLCPREKRQPYVAFKNLQPHLCSKHFGLPSRGKTSGVSFCNNHNISRCQTLTVFRTQNV